MDKPINYISNDEFLRILIEYSNNKEVNTDLPCPEEIARYFLMISTRLANRWNFSGYTYKEDMISEGVLCCLKYMDNFNPSISTNAFGYFTQLIFRTFQQILNTERKHRNIKIDYQDKITNEELFVRMKNGVKSYREFNKAISIEPELKDTIIQQEKILGWEQEIPINDEMSKILCLFQDDEEKN